MFTVGEFSRLAQVSKRLLRYYDEIGLLIPAHIDPVTRYRYYSAEQMLDLNRILALKGLGLSLEQIREMLADQISMDEMQGMLLLKKAEIEQQMLAEQQRLRSIESRLQAIRQAQTNQSLNVVLKQVPVQSVLNLRTIAADFQAALEIFGQVRKALPDSGLQYCICHDESHVETDMDLEIGVIVEEAFRKPVLLGGDLKLCPDELPEAETMASIVVKGALETIHMSYTQVGLWMEQAGYRLAGMARELTLQVPQAADGSDLISEIQFPVKHDDRTA
jgi:DNA-binding transcriptional MerR regulator